MTSHCDLAKGVADQLLERNRLCEKFFAGEAPRLARAAREMAERFLRGGRLLAFGRGPYATDAQHVSVEFVHPVIVGKRALPALDLSIAFRPWLEAILCANDMVMGFGAAGRRSGGVVGAGRGARARGDDVRAARPRRGLCRQRAHAAPVHSPGNHRDALPRALGDGARILRASRAGARHRRCRVPLSIPGTAEATDRRCAGRSGGIHPAESAGRCHAAGAGGRRAGGSDRRHRAGHAGVHCDAAAN